MTTDPSDVTAVVIPRSVFWGLMVPLIGGFCAGSAYMAGLSMTVANQGTNQVALAARISAVETKVEANKEAGAVKTDGINDRLTRMEAQLSFLVTTSKGQK